MKWGRLIWDHRFLQMMLALYIPSLWVVPVCVHIYWKITLFSEPTLLALFFLTNASCVYEWNHFWLTYFANLGRQTRSRCHNQIFSWICYAEIKYSDWPFKVTWLDLTNQIALFQHSNATLKYDINSRATSNLFIHMSMRFTNNFILRQGGQTFLVETQWQKWFCCLTLLKWSYNGLVGQSFHTVQSERWNI